MSPIGHSILADAAIKTVNTPLKASVVLLSSVILASCGGSGSSSTPPYEPTTTIPGAPVDDSTDTGNNGDGNSDNQQDEITKLKASLQAALDNSKQAKADAQKAQAEAIKAKEDLSKAQADLVKLNGVEDKLTTALDRAKAAEAVANAAKVAEAKAKAAQKTAEEAKAASDEALVAAEKAAELAIGDAKANADKLVAQAKAETNAANKAAAAAAAEAKAAVTAKKLAETARDNAIKKAQDAQSEILEAENNVKKANERAATERVKAQKAQADAIKAKEELSKAQADLEKLNGVEDKLATALDRAKAAEALVSAAKVAEAKAKAAQKTAEEAKAASDAALVAAEKAAALAVGKAKADADKRVAQAKAETDAANKAATKAKEEADKAKSDAQTAIAAANAQKEAAEAQAVASQQAAQTAQQQAAAEKQRADKAAAEAEQAKADLAAAQQALEEAEKALTDALASGGSTEALQAEVDRRQAALEAAQAEQAAAEQAAAAAEQAAADQIAAANQAATDAQQALAAAQIKNDAEVDKSGVQTLNVDVVPLNKVFNTTTRDFSADENSVIARADIASIDQTKPNEPGLLGEVPITISGANDPEVSGTNGFMSHEDSAVVGALGQELPLTYTSTYKDFGDDMRIGHIDGKAVFSGLELPVNGAAVIGNATKAANMPTEGTVGYTGDATYRKMGLGNDIEFGSSVFTADFVQKNLDGKLSFASAGNIDLTASISGNQFSGAADNGGYLTEGGFYGGDAQYLGGVYEGNGAQGTYGAKSDKQTAAEQAAAEAQAAAKAAQAAIAVERAKAEAAKAAAEKAKADAVKAQTALEQAQANLENAGNGEDLLAAALERAASAETAAAAAENAAQTAQAAEQAALTAQAAAEAAVVAANEAAEQAVGEAKAEADKLVAEAEKQRDDAQTAAANAEAAKVEAESAKAEAEQRAKEAEEALAAATAIPDAPTNPAAPASTTVSGYQNSIADSDNGAIVDNNSQSLDVLSTRLDTTGSSRFDKSYEMKITSAADEELAGGFKKGPLNSDNSGYASRKLNYTSIYNNFNNQMQIGHLYGDHKNAFNVRLTKISTVYAQGNNTSTEDMAYMKELSQYNIDNGINDGKVDYAGVASYIGNSKNEIIGANPIIGTSQFKVDFVDQQVDGTLSFEGTSVKDKKIKAVIKDNTFAGNWNGVETKGGFYGLDAGLLGGIYQTNTGKGTYGATKVDFEAPPAPVESKMTGFQSTTLSSIEQNVAGTQLDNAIGYVEIRDDTSDFTETTIKNGSVVPVDNGQGDNFNSFNNGVVRADMVKPENVADPLAVSLKQSGEVVVEAGKGSVNPKFKYTPTYKNFENQMQVGHVYGNFVSLLGDVSRATNVYVEGYRTSLAGMEGLKDINEGKASYTGKATYIENIHLGDTGSFAPVDGTSSFDVDFVNSSVKGELLFNGDFKYMPTGNKIGIEAIIEGNNFVSDGAVIGTPGGIDVAGSFYGEDAKFLGGIYQDASVEGGKGDLPGSGTRFQGTFGAQKQ